MSDRVRVGVIGAGEIGKIHIQNIASSIPGAEVTALADIYIEAAMSFAKKGRPVKIE
jgi:myo-inositol 2-dehydrogenase/D-chiro-inositol 1-dehydrogenase